MNDSLNWQGGNSAPQEGASDAPFGGGGMDLWGMLLRRKWLIILGVIIGTGWGYLQFTKAKPYYISSARIIVENKNPEVKIADIHTIKAGDDHLANDVEVLKSASFKMEALAVKNLPPLQGSYRIIQDKANKSAINFTYTSRKPNECKDALSALIDHYITYLEESQRSMVQKTKELISEAKNELGKEVDLRKQEYTQFRESTNLVLTSDTATNPFQTQLSGIVSRKNALWIKQTQLIAERDAIKDAMDGGANREAMLMMIDKLGQHNAALEKSKLPEEKSLLQTRASLTTRLYPFLLEKQTLLQSGHGAEHPKVVAIDKKIDFVRAMYQQQTIELKNNQPAKKPLIAKKQIDLLAVYLGALQQEINIHIKESEQLDAQYKKVKVKAQALATEEIQYSSLKNTRERTERLFEAIVGQLEKLELGKNVGGKEIDIVRAPHAGIPQNPEFSRMLSMGGMGGLVIGLVLAFLVELSDKTFRTPADIIAELKLPVIGHIPTLPDDVLNRNTGDHQLDGSICTFYTPRSRLAEAFRAVRTALFFNTRGNGHQLIQVTSPAPGDGKSTLCVNLATVIAQSGKKCLIIDADLRRPRVHVLLGADRSIGVTSVISGEFELADAIQSTEVDNLYCLPSGPRPQNPSELLTSPRFESMLEVLREKYDFVLIDTPPLLAVTDPGVVAARADGVILAMRISRKSRKLAKRATELLSQVGARVLGVVVNGVGVSVGYTDGYGTAAGKYDAKSYSYGYGSSEYSEYEEYYAHKTDDDSFEYENISTSKARMKRISSDTTFD